MVCPYLCMKLIITSNIFFSLNCIALKINFPNQMTLINMLGAGEVFTEGNFKEVSCISEIPTF